MLVVSMLSLPHLTTNPPNSSSRKLHDRLRTTVRHEIDSSFSLSANGLRIPGTFALRIPSEFAGCFDRRVHAHKVGCLLRSRVDVTNFQRHRGMAFVPLDLAGLLTWVGQQLCSAICALSLEGEQDKPFSELLESLVAAAQYGPRGVRDMP